MNRQITAHRLVPALVMSAAMMCAGVSHAVTSATDTQCDSRLDVTVAASSRSSAATAANCQTRPLTTAAGFTLAASSPADATTPDSSAMVAAGGELYKSFVGGIRQSLVVLTPNRSLMMSRKLSRATGMDWDMGFTVQPVTNGNNAYMYGTYVFLRANRETRVVDAAHQTNAGLSQVFDPAILRVTFNGDATCTVNSYNSWFGYELTTDPALFYNQPDGANYGLHQAVYAGAGSGQQHKDSGLSFSSCTYTLGTDGKLVVNYVGTKGDASAFNVNNAYFVSADMRYIVSTVDATKDLYRGFEVGVRVTTLSGTQSALNNSAAGTYLFNAPSVELQGATGPLTAPNNEHRNNSKTTQCLNRGALVLTTTASGVAGWNTCSIDMANSCAIRSEEGYGETSSGAGNGSVSIIHQTTENIGNPSCRFQVATDSTLSVVMNQPTAEGSVDVSYSGALANGNQTLVLRGKYEGSNMANPSNTYAPARTIKNDLYLAAFVGIQYSGSLVADADSDGTSNEAEFLDSVSTSTVANSDFNGDGTSDVMLRNPSTGQWQLSTFSNGTVSGSTNPSIDSSSDTAYMGQVDTNGDHTVEVLTRSFSTGVWSISSFSAGAFAGTTPLLFMTTNSSWQYQGMGDFDGDGTSEILLRNSSTGMWGSYIFNNSAYNGIGFTQGAYLLNGSDYVFQGLGDMNGDGKDDGLLRSSSTGTWYIVNPVDLTWVNPALPTSSDWQFQALVDVNGDNIKDIVVRNTNVGSGSAGVWQVYTLGSDYSVVGSYVMTNLPTNLAIQLTAVGNFDGYGSNDLLLRNSSSGAYALYVTNPPNPASQTLKSVPALVGTPWAVQR